MKKTNHKKTHSFIKSVASVEKPDRDTTVYHMNCKDGSGVLTVFNVFPGIDLIYQEFESASCAVMTHTDDNIIELNYCHEGRAEYRMKDGSLIYLGEGDMIINTMRNHSDNIEFPLKHYKGFTVIFYIDKFAEEISRIKLLNDLNIDFYALCEKLLANTQHLMIYSRDKIDQIFNAMYSAPKASRKTYFKLKMLELLVFLNFFEVSSEEQRKLYFQQQVDIIKHINKQITENPKANFTIEALARQNCISSTTLKTYYKEIYGIPIAAYIRANRMRHACTLLSQPQINISDVAREVGYNSPSKFAAAFKKFMKISPMEYRKKVSQIKVLGRNLSEQALELSDRRYQAIVENQTELICRYLPDTTLTFVNEAYSLYYGKSREGMLGKKFITMILDTDRERFENHIASLCNENPSSTIEHRVILPDGSIRWQQWTNRAIFSKLGQLVEYQSVGRDITERKLVEENLISERDRLFSLLDRLPAHVILIAPDYTIRFSNTSFRKYFGEPKGRLCYELYFNSCRRCHNCLVQVVFQNGAQIEWEWVSPEGEIFQIFHHPFHDIDGTILALEMIVKTTECKDIEDNMLLPGGRFLNAFFDSPALMTFNSLKDMRCLDVNNNFLRYTGYSREELIGTKLAKLNVFNSRSINEVLQKVLLHGSCSNYEIPIRKKSGNVSIVLLSAEKTCLDNEQVMFSIVTAYYRLKTVG